VGNEGRPTEPEQPLSEAGLSAPHRNRYDSGMPLFLLILGVTCAALIIWLTVRFVNRREAWARRLLMGMIFVMVAYPLSFPPACWLGRNLYPPDPRLAAVNLFYSP
jgi:hypothetical protein